MNDAALTALLLISAILSFPGDASAADEEAAQRVTVRLTEYHFEPDRITLTAGQKAELILKNEGTVMHEFVTAALQNLDVAVEINGIEVETTGVSELEIPPSGVAVLRWTPEKPDVFPIFCYAKKPKNHFEQGMNGKLVIR